ncbi:GntR family transcriptional regulator [Marinobacter salicampi]|uniref:GntR family transcriptional regulator n=1 Tax=Marinobacter salicampi TaxID=435907 RepID=UPI001409F4A7|nr:GntR family transcriptional regulator [Marinobacter salicampi]
MDFQVPNTLAEQIANYLGDRIMTGAIRPGERIQEATVAAELRVSRASVKEALFTLERWHLVDITPRRGASASVLDADHAAELYDVYMHLLIMLARRLCERWREPDREPLVSQVHAATLSIQAKTPDVSAIVQASFDVMDLCCEVVGNPYLSEALSNFKPAVSRAYFFSAARYRQDLDRTGAFFTRLTRAVLARDADDAEKQVTGFANHQKQLILNALSPDASLTL